MTRIREEEDVWSSEPGLCIINVSAYWIVWFESPLWILDCGQRAQTSTKASNLSPKWSRIQVWINPDSDPDVCRIARKMFSRVSWKWASDCMRNAKKSPKNPLFGNIEWSWKVIWNLYLWPDHHQKLISSCDLFGPVVTVPLQCLWHDSVTLISTLLIIITIIIAPSFSQIGWLLLQ